MDKTHTMPSTYNLEQIASQGYYYIIRLPHEDRGTYESEAVAKHYASRLSPRVTENGFQIVRISLR